jgi:TetR/AcrR family transcriptional regulator, mexJK operon transcriptional repressor
MEKRAAILMAAAGLFIRNGYADTAMEQIALQAGVSKLTVYNHFSSKELLFDAVVEAKCDQHFGGRDFSHFAGHPAGQALRTIAERFLQLLLSEDVLAMHRMLVGSAASHPELCERFYAAGPAQALASLSALLRGYHERGELTVPDPDWAADHFFALLHGKLHLRASMNIGRLPTRKQVTALIESAVPMFLRAYQSGLSA